MKSGTVMKVFSSKNRPLLDPVIKMHPRFFHWSTFTNTSVIYLLTRFLSQWLWQTRVWKNPEHKHSRVEHFQLSCTLSDGGWEQHWCRCKHLAEQSERKKWTPSILHFIYKWIAVTSYHPTVVRVLSLISVIHNFISLTFDLEVGKPLLSLEWG